MPQQIVDDKGTFLKPFLYTEKYTKSFEDNLTCSNIGDYYYGRRIKCE